MPKWTFENKITLGNLIQIAFIIAALFAAYYGITGAIAKGDADNRAQDTTIAAIQAMVAPLAPAINNLDTRLTVGESASSADRKRMDSQDELNRQLLEVVQALSVKVAEMGRDVSYLRRDREQAKREDATE